MPKLVDYASRYEFMRQAAFALVRDLGTHALTRRALAAELGCGINTICRLVDPSTELAVLAADEVRTRRRKDRWGRLPEEPEAAARVLIRRLLPDDDSRIDEELVWLRLVASYALVPSGRATSGAVRHDFQVAERGWSDVDPEPVGAEVVDPDPTPGHEPGPSAGRPDRTAQMARYFTDRHTEVDNVVRRVISLLEVAEPEAETVRLRALVEGLTSAVCTQRVSPRQCLESMDRHLAELRQPPARVAG